MNSFWPFYMFYRILSQTKTNESFQIQFVVCILTVVPAVNSTAASVETCSASFQRRAWLLTLTKLIIHPGSVDTGCWKCLGTHAAPFAPIIHSFPNSRGIIKHPKIAINNWRVSCFSPVCFGLCHDLWLKSFHFNWLHKKCNFKS